MIEFFPSHRPGPLIGQQVDERSRKAHQDGRVRRDNKLRSLNNQVVKAAEQRKSPRWGHGRLRLIQDVQAARPEPVQHKREEGFAVRNFVKWPRPVSGRYLRAKLLYLGGNIEEAFSPKEEAGARAGWVADQPKMVRELRDMPLRAEVEVG